MNILTIFVAKFKDRREEGEVSDVEKLGPDADYVPQENIVSEKSDAEVDHKLYSKQKVNFSVFSISDDEFNQSSWNSEFYYS